MREEIKQALIESALSYLIYYYFIQDYKDEADAANNFDNDFVEEHKCTLCKVTRRCDECPIYKHTKKQGCHNTPFDDFEECADNENYRLYRQTLYKEYELLASLVE